MTLVARFDRIPPSSDNLLVLYISKSCVLYMKDHDSDTFCMDTIINQLRCVFSINKFSVVMLFN